MANNVTVIVLAAGGGTRMKSRRMKVLHEIGGRSMIGHVLAAVGAVEPRRVVAVVGHQREEVGAHILEHAPSAVLAVQETQEGTGHAARMAIEALAPEERTGTFVVVTADTPLLRGETFKGFVDEHAASGRTMTILSGVLDNPFGYGRVIRDGSGAVTGIVEEKDATDEQRAVREVSSGILAFDGEFLAQAVERIDNANAKGEYYLTDTVKIARSQDREVGAYRIADVTETRGANDRAELAELGRILNQRIVTRWMKEGATIMDPATTWVESDVVLRPDVTILPGTQLLGATVIETDAVVGPDCTLKDCEVGEGARVVRTHAELAVIGPRTNVGPFSYLRPGTELGEAGKIGAFVETKNAHISSGAKVPHLSYVGDAEVGEGTNIGAGTIFANYDGVTKHRTTVGRHARTGSNNTFVAPVRIGDGAVTGGGTVVREDVPPGALAVSAGPQRNIAGWVFRRRPGTPAERAAREAGASQEGPSHELGHLGSDD